MKQLWFSAIHSGFPNTHFCHIFLLQENLFFMQDNLGVNESYAILQANTQICKHRVTNNQN